MPDEDKKDWDKISTFVSMDDGKKSIFDNARNLLDRGMDSCQQLVEDGGMKEYVR